MADQVLQVPIAIIREATERLLAHVEDAHSSTVNLPWDYYWEMPADDLYQPHTEPINHTLGQLSFDIDSLKDLIDRPVDEAVSYGLVWAGEVMKAIGHHLVA